jgi:hypothetical protein
MQFLSKQITGGHVRVAQKEMVTDFFQELYSAYLCDTNGPLPCYLTLSMIQMQYFA